MADLIKLKNLMDAYGVGVRAGVITPNADDEAALREQFGLPPMNASVLAAWADSKGVRFPITLAQGLDETAGQPGAPAGE